MVVVAAGAHEQRLAAEARGRLEAEPIDVESPGRRDIADGQVHMADLRVTEPLSTGQASAGLPSAGPLGQVLGKELIRVEVESRHLDLSVHPAPLGAVPVPVQFDAVAFGVGEVERLAHQVVGAPGERSRCQARHRVDGGGERLLRVEEDRGVEQARIVRRGVLQFWGVLQDHDRRRAPAEHRDTALLAEQAQRHAVAVVGDHAVEIGDAQRHGSHGRVGCQEFGHSQCNAAPPAGISHRIRRRHRATT